MRHSIRSSIPIAALVVLVAAAANAATYSMTGRAARGGVALDLPFKNDVPCPSITGKIGFATMTMHTMTMTKLIGPVVHNAYGCAGGGPAKVTPTAMGGFDIPAKFFKQPVPGMLRLSAAPNFTPVLQVATSWGLTGPLTAPLEPINPIVTGKAYAPWRKVQPTAWDSQTGRAGLNFTACGGTVANLACTKPSQGAIPAIIKVIGGSNPGGGGFGGTMGLVITAGTLNPSSIVAKQPGGKAFVNPIDEAPGFMRTLADGRGYGAYDMDIILSGTLFNMYMLTTAKTPLVAIVSTVMTPLFMGGAGTAMNWGFPLTTGDVVGRGTGKDGMGNPVGVTWTAMGTDKASTMLPGIAKAVPGGRLIQLVSGSVAQNTLAPQAAASGYVILRLPEPSGVLQLFAGAAGLIAIAAWRALKTR